MTEKDIMFWLISSEITGAKIDSDMFQDLSIDTYNRLYVLSQKHDLSHIVAAALSGIGLLRDDEISGKFNKQLALSLFRDSQREYTLNQLSSILEKAEIPYIMLKGSIIRDMYPQPWMRTSCDVDVLVPKEESKAAIETLCMAGYQRLEDCSTHDYSFMSPNKIHIELHYTLTQEDELNYVDEVLENVWAEYATLTEGYRYRYDLNPEAFIVYHLAHMGRHIVTGGCGIRPFIDLWLIRKHMSFDNNKLYSLLHQTNLLTFYETAVELSEVWLEAHKHNKNTIQLETFILSGGVYGTVSNAAKMKSAKKIGKLRSFAEIVFLPRKNLQVIYPILEKYPILLPIYQVKRWFNIFNQKKRQKVKFLVDVRNSVSVEETNSMFDLLKDLGLDH